MERAGRVETVSDITLIWHAVLGAWVRSQQRCEVGSSAMVNERQGFQMTQRVFWNLVCLGGICGSVQASEVITLHYHERPPYMITEPDGTVRGVTATKAAQAFEQAGIAVKWQQTPPSRQLLVLQAGAGMDCGLGWFKNAERERLSLFSKAIYRDKPFVVIARPGLKLAAYLRFEDLLLDPKLTLLVKEHYSYGEVVDELLAKRKPRTEATSADVAHMVDMIQMGRGDYMLAAQEEADFYLNARRTNHPAVNLRAYADLPEGNDRYIMCNRAVGERLIGQLNSAIR